MKSKHLSYTDLIYGSGLDLLFVSTKASTNGQVALSLGAPAQELHETLLEAFEELYIAI